MLRAGYRGDWPARAWARVPGSCDVERTDVAVTMLAGASAPLRIGFVSDVHIGPTTPPRLLHRAFDELARARPDLLLLGGDYVFLDADEARARTLSDLVRSVPCARKLAVLGNHDLWTRHGLLERALERAGVEVLVNRSTAVGAGALHVVGLDDPWTGTPDVRAAFEEAHDARALVVLCHSPDGLPLIARDSGPPRPTLFVCGHTHGGHIATPWGPIVHAGAACSRKYSRGRHRVDGVDLYVSRGVGGIELPVRTFARPEIVVFSVT